MGAARASAINKADSAASNGGADVHGSERDATATTAHSKRVCRRADATADVTGMAAAFLPPPHADAHFDSEICHVMGLLAYEPAQLTRADCPLAHLAGPTRVEHVIRLVNQAILLEAM